MTVERVEQAGGKKDQERYKRAYQFDDNETSVTVAESERLKPFSRRFAYFFADNDTRELADACRKLEAMVFRRHFDKDESGKDKQDHRDLMPELYGDSEERSKFIGIVDRKTGELAGTIRVISGEKSTDFGSINDSIGREVDEDSLEETIKSYHEDFDPEKTWEVGTLAVADKYRGKGVGLARAFGARVSSMLYHRLYKETEKTWEGEGPYGNKGVKQWIMMIQEKAYNQLRSYGIPVEPFCDQEPLDEYYGAKKTHPSYIAIEEITPRMKERSPFMHAALVKGLGITAFMGQSKLDTAA